LLVFSNKVIVNVDGWAVDSHEAIDNGSAVNGVNGGTDVDFHDAVVTWMDKLSSFTKEAPLAKHTVTKKRILK